IRTAPELRLARSTPISAVRGWRGLLRARWRPPTRVDPGGGGLGPNPPRSQVPFKSTLTHAGVVDAARTRLERISDTEREETKSRNSVTFWARSVETKATFYRNRWSSVPAQQSPSLERAYRPRSRNAHFFRCSVRDARGSAAAQNWATLPTLCKCTACQIWWLGMACGLR
ncbi:unnamed protein product, partial [Pelagomonas calceolata]